MENKSTIFTDTEPLAKETKLPTANEVKTQNIALKLKENTTFFFKQMKLGCFRTFCYNPYCAKSQCNSFF